MNIVLPVHHFPPRYSAGAELYTLRLARWLRAHGHQAEVVCVEHIDQGMPGVISAEHDSYQDVPVWRLSFALQHAPDPFLWSYDNPLIGRWFADYLRRVQPDLVHLQSGYMMTASVLEAARQQGVPTIITLHDFWFLCPRITLLRSDGRVCESVPTDPAACAWCMRLSSRRYRIPDQVTGGLFGKALRMLKMDDPHDDIAARRTRLAESLGYVDAAIAPSRFLASVFSDVLRPEQLRILRYGLDSERLRNTPPPPDDGTLRIGYIGQVAAHKGVHVLTEAVQMLPTAGRPVTLTIYGDLNQHVTYSRGLTRKIGNDPRIRLAGRFDNSRITEVLGSFDVTVVPSVWYENSPLAIMEAHAAGRPVLTSALGGMAELVRDGVDGLHFRPGDAADLARQIQRLRTDPKLLAQLRQGIVAPATIDDEMETMLQIYRETAAEHRIPPVVLR